VSSPRGSRLIVHGDDFGLSEAVNDGIVDAHRRGILTSTSLMASGAAFEHAVALAKECPSLDVGVHLTLTEERPLSPAAARSRLVDATGRFPPHLLQFAALHARGKIPLDAVRIELAAQIERSLATGLPITHLDGHQHVHVLPGIAPLVAELARAHGIRAVRYPVERMRGYMLQRIRGLRRLAEQLALGVVGRRSPLRKLKCIDEFAGFYFGGRLDEPNLLTVLAALPAGRTVELMCHPGNPDTAGRYHHWNYSWPAERDALVSGRVRALLRERGVRLISYRDL
jgi:hopanoid biosynthesis associated protein HpnK